MHALHNTIGAPHIKITKQGKTKATLVMSPLPSGFGITIGNALRRILLSSLPGTAVTAVKIDGVAHEYSSIPGVKDSSLDIILNLRSLRLRKHSPEPEIAELSLVKKGNLTAKDIKLSSDIEILDPSQPITQCDGADSKKKIYLRIEKGVGFRVITNEDNTNEADPEFLLIDANFSPIIKAEYRVEPARVGEQTNLDQLHLELETNGAIEAEQALKLSANILENYFQLFNEDDAYTDDDFTASFSTIKLKEKAAADQAAKANEETFTPIDVLGFSQRTLNALVNGGIISVEQLLKTPVSQLSQLRGFGQKAKQEMEAVFKEQGYNQEITESKTSPTTT